MIRRNLLGLETRRGFCTCELLQGDITDLEGPIDLLVASAFAGSYVPTPGTVLGALRDRWRVEARELARAPEYDLRAALSVWVSRLPHGPFDRLMCVELVGAPRPIAEVVKGAFAAASLLEATGERIRSIAMPVLGAGQQQIPLEAVLGVLVTEARKLAQRSDALERILFVELDPERASALSEALDALLGRPRVLLPKSQVLGTLRADVASQLADCAPLFTNSQSTLHGDLSKLISQPEIRSVELGVNVRRFAEHMVNDVGPPGTEPLHQRIRTLEKAGTVAPWICGYLQLLRHFGNEAAHEMPPQTRFPPVVQEDDLTIALFCLGRLLSVWPECRKVSRPTA